jgi:glycosyltransferase involved in cell wall biosynthesis
MKIIYLANARIPTEKAHGLQIMKMADAFKGQGIDLELVVAKRINNQMETVDPFAYYCLSNRFLIKKIWLWDLVDWEWLPRKIAVFLQNFSFAISAFIYLVAKKVDWIYSRDAISLFFLCFFKKNLVLELHNFPRSKIMIYQLIFKRVEKIVVLTSYLKQLIIELGISENKILVCPDGVDLKDYDLPLDREQCRRQLGLPSDKNIILYSGHLFAWKGVYTLAASAKYLTDKELIVMVGGMSYDRQKLNQFIQNESLKNILLIDHQMPKQIPYYLKAADILVLPNSRGKKISEYYTSPMKLFEYLASGKPIIASDLPSLREVLNDKNSLLIAPDQPSVLAEAIKKIIADQTRAKALASQALTEAEQYSWQNRVTKILKFISNHHESY